MLSNLEKIIGDRTLPSTFEHDVIAGLSRPQPDKAVPAKHLYDAVGSELFERICDLEEYYPTRVEASIFEESLPNIAERLGTGLVLVEPGAGNGDKAARLLDALEEPPVFAPIEISRDALEAASLRIASRLPDIAVQPVCAEFVRGLNLLGHLPEARRAVFFPGSTIGNLLPHERISLLCEYARFVGSDGHVLVTYDMVKDPEVLVAAYADREGVTAAFDLNLLARINRELDGDLDVDGFRHEAIWDADLERIEMRLGRLRDQHAPIRGHEVSFGRGERIHTENSHKFTAARIDIEAARAGLEVVETWRDRKDWLRVVLLRAR